MKASDFLFKFQKRQDNPKKIFETYLGFNTVLAIVVLLIKANIQPYNYVESNVLVYK